MRKPVAKALDHPANESLKDTRRGTATLLPDPEPRPLWCPFISVDDHFLEPPDTFERRVPRRFRERAPHVQWDDEDVPYWVVEGEQVPITVTNGASGRPVREWNLAPQKYEEFREGTWNVHARIRDMDINGVWGSLNFPSVIWGFAGSRFARMADQELALASMRAYNDWILEAWVGEYPERFIPCQIPWLMNPLLAAREVRRNADRGFTAVSFSENPEGLDLPGIYTDHWDPFFRACEETGTVVNLHVGSSGSISRPSGQSPVDVVVALFPLNGILAAVDWIYARIPVRFPGLKIVLSEAGVSWVPMVIERLRRAYRQVEASPAWSASDPDPVDLLHRNFWFASIEDPSAFSLLDVIGEENVMVESDYPHQDSSWPETQEMLRGQLGELSTATIQRICFETAADLYRHPPPPPQLLAKSVVGQAAGERGGT